MFTNEFDRQYKKRGLMAQRLYPNENLVAFLGQNYWGRSAEERKKIKVLEVGCGTGANLWMLAKENFDVYGIDSSNYGIELAKVHLNEKWGVDGTLKVGDFTNIPFPEAMFDVVVDVVSLQHIDLKTSEKAFDEINRVLKKGGKFFSYRLSDNCAMYDNSGGEKIDEVTVDNIYNELMPLNNNGVCSFWSSGLIKMYYKKAGFQNISIEKNSRSYNNNLYNVEYLSVVASKG